jgi:L-ascorbate metabolism protein UlaG (beta-lactamase superfamily)
MREHLDVDFFRRLDTVSITDNMLVLAALGQAGFAIKAGSTIIYIDLYLSDTLTTASAPPCAIPIVVAPEEIRHAVAVLCTHEHGDHTDPATILPLAAASPAATIFASP